jgi:hypothetical protein
MKTKRKIIEINEELCDSFSTEKNLNVIWFGMLQARGSGLALHEHKLGWFKDLGRWSQFCNQGRWAYAGSLKGLVA